MSETDPSAVPAKPSTPSPRASARLRGHPGGNLSLPGSQGSFNQLLTPPAMKIFQANSGAGGVPSQTIGTKQTAIAETEDLTCKGVAFFLNLDPTNYSRCQPCATWQARSSD